MPSLLAHPTWQNCGAAVFLICSQEVPVPHLGYTTGYHEYTDFLTLQAYAKILNSGWPLPLLPKSIHTQLSRSSSHITTHYINYLLEETLQNNLQLTNYHFLTKHSKTQ
jgi:hypothetical protein